MILKLGDPLRAVVNPMTENLSEAADGQSFKLRVPLAARIAYAIPLAVLAFGTAMTARAASGLLYSLATWPGSRLGLKGLSWAAGVVLLTAAFAALTVAVGYWLVMRLVLEAKRGSVVLNDREVSITNWRGTNAVAWADVKELRILHLPGGPPRVTLEAESGRTAISPWVCRREVLVEQIVSRAGLTEKRQRPFVTRYLRPRVSDPAV